MIPRSQEVLAEVEQIDTSKTSGILFVSSLVFKIAFTVLLPKITYLYNLFPSAWGRSCVTPIPTGGDVKIVSNWRPISLIPLPGKILEKLIHRRLLDVLMGQDFLSDNQYAFRSGRSTGQAI